MLDGAPHSDSVIAADAASSQCASAASQMESFCGMGPEKRPEFMKWCAECFPASQFACYQRAVDCDGLYSCDKEREADLKGTVVATCAQFCEKCEACHREDPAFDETDCRDYASAATSECMTNCEGSIEIKNTLGSVAKPISTFLCCEIDMLL
jgi:hypothetical protein